MGTLGMSVLASALVLIAMMLIGEVMLLRLRAARRALNTRRADAVRAHAMRLASLDEKRDAMLRLAKAQEPYDALERYASRLRDANEVHRMRERVLIRIADVAAVCKAGAMVNRDPRHSIALVKILDWDALCEALKAWGSTVVVHDTPVERSNNLSGPTEDPPEAA